MACEHISISEIKAPTPLCLWQGPTFSGQGPEINMAFIRYHRQQCHIVKYPVRPPGQWRNEIVECENVVDLCGQKLRKSAIPERDEGSKKAVSDFHTVD